MRQRSVREFDSQVNICLSRAVRLEQEAADLSGLTARGSRCPRLGRFNSRVASGTRNQDLFGELELILRPGRAKGDHVGGRTDGSGIADVIGRVVESERASRLAITFEDPNEGAAPASLVTFTIEEYKDIVRLSIVHENIPTPKDAEAAALGWAAVGSNLKSLLETGRVLPQAPWDMHAQVREARMRSKS